MDREGAAQFLPELRRELDAPYGFDGAMEDLMWIGSRHTATDHTSFNP
jgi:hypothetical protein